MAAELLKRFFLAEIESELFPTNEFLSASKNDDAYVNNNSVELPNAGTLPEVAVDRTVLPAPITKRTDVAHNYELEELTTEPTLIQDSEELIRAYNKRQDVLMQHVDKQNTKCADRALAAWATGLTGSAVVPTTGSPRDTLVGAGVGTGVRNAMTKADIQNAMTVLTNQDVPTKGRVCLIPANFLNDILNIPEFTEVQKFGPNSSLREGAIGRIMGFDVYVRSKALAYDAAGVLKAEGAAFAATDNDAALFWHPQFVRRAKGSVKVYIDDSKPEYYGGIFSTMVRFGAQQARIDQKGIVAIRETV